MLRTICVLEPGEKQDGGKCLRGQLGRSFTSRDQHGTERHYPTGTPIILVRNAKGGSYSLLAQLPDEEPISFDAEVLAQPFEDSPF